MNSQTAYARRWQPLAGPPPPDSYLSELPSLLREVLWRRGHHDQEAARAFLRPSRFRLPEPDAYPSLMVAVDRLFLAIDQRQPICVWGDYDADGQTATALLVGVLRSLDAVVSYHVPKRLHDDRGLDCVMLERLAAEGCRVVLTCDCGTSDAQEVAWARELGIDVVITDHHQQMGPLPAAVAICNSSHLPKDDPLWGLPGVAMAYILARALYRRAGRPAEEHVQLDLVALGIVADVAPLTPTNRALLARGLTRIWQGPRPGVRALLDLTGWPAWELDSEPISFKLAPALNAAGRLADACLGVRLLLADEPLAAQSLAAQLWGYNCERRRLTAALECELRADLAAQPPGAGAVVLAGTGWHPGLIGLAASHLMHELGCAVAVISRDPEGGPARGSVRAGRHVDILAVLAAQADLLDHWGGHAHAAGFALADERIAAFRERFTAAVSRLGACPGPTLPIDAMVPWSTLAADTLGAESPYATLMRLAPFSEGNRPPILAATGLHVVAQRPVGAGNRHTKLILVDQERVSQEVMWWNSDPAWQPEGLVDVACTLSSNEWQGNARLRLTLEGIRPHTGGQEERESSG